ncbi:hypothetical protein F5Y03DRAFT_356254 [Xylaria venustula]|nr:hypothetical protein F5Y03DRAFT_356254 [Xylaria venustula]
MLGLCCLVDLQRSSLFFAACFPPFSVLRSSFFVLALVVHLVRFPLFLLGTVSFVESALCDYYTFIVYRALGQCCYCLRLFDYQHPFTPRRLFIAPSGDINCCCAVSCEP